MDDLLQRKCNIGGPRPWWRGAPSFVGLLLAVGVSAPSAAAAAGPSAAHVGEALPGPLAAAVQASSADTLDGNGTQANGDDRDRAVRLAREGRYEEALTILRPLYAERPDHQGLRVDLVSVLSWAGEHAEALELAEGLSFLELEPFVAEAVGRSAREEGFPRYAAELYAHVVSLAPDRVDGQIGRALSLLEAGRLAEAEARVPILLERFPHHPEARIAVGHVLRAQGRYVEAASQFRRAREIDPEHDEALRAEVMTLAEAGAGHLAVERMDEAPHLFEPAERARALAVQGARAVEWASAAPSSTSPSERFAATDAALAKIDAALARLETDGGEEVGFYWYQLRFDRIVALRERVRMEEALAEVEALEAEGVEMPPYVQRIGADAALYLRRPDEAARRYRRALEGWPGHPETRLGLFYALVEANRHDEAREVITALLEEQPEVLGSERLAERQPNPARLSAEIARLLGEAFAGNLVGAQAELEELSAMAPHNLEIRQELASVYLWRGWPRDARAEYERILALDPEHLGARIGRAAADLQLRDLGKARATTDTLLAAAPENQHVRRTARDVLLEGRWELSVQAGEGRSTGGELGTRDRMIRSRLLTPPVADRVRLFVGGERSDAEFDDGTGIHDRVSAGLELRTRPLRLSVSASADREELDRHGGGATLELFLGDRWTMELSGSSRSLDVPLQARRVGVEGWRARGRLIRRPHEARHWTLEGSFMDLSDGNQRVSAYAAVEQRLVQRPGGRFGLLLEGYGAWNSLEDAPYFNPESIATPSASLYWDWIPWQSYERSLTLHTGAGGGGVFQDGFDPEPQFEVRHEHRWEVANRFQLVYGVRWGRPVYDGERERRTHFHSGLTWRIP